MLVTPRCAYGVAGGYQRDINQVLAQPLRLESVHRGRNVRIRVICRIEDGYAAVEP